MKDKKLRLLRSETSQDAQTASLVEHFLSSDVLAPSIYQWFHIKQILDGRTKGACYRQETARALEWALAGYRGPGNMIGSGFYRSPAAVAPYGNLAILIWLVMGAGSS